MDTTLPAAPGRALRLPGLAIGDVLVLALFAVAFALAAQPRIDVDLGWHLRTGQLIWETGAIPHADPYSFTVAGQPWITHEWLAEWLMYPLYARFGFGGPLALCAAAITVGLWLAYRQLREDGTGQVAAALLTLFASLAAMDVWGSRPLAFTLALGPLFALALRRWWRGQERSLWVLPVLMTVWVNLHGGYVFGLGLMALYLGAGVLARWLGTEAPRGSLARLSVATGACLLATLANPNTYHILWYPFDTLSSGAMRAYLQDWPSPDFHQLRFAPFGAMLALFFLVAARAPGRLGVDGVVLVLALGALALQSNRHVPLFAIVTVPVLGRWLPALEHDRDTLLDRLGLCARLGAANRPLGRSPLLSALNWLLAVLVLAGVAVRLSESLPHATALAVQARYFPAGAVEFMRREGISGRLYNAYNWGGYLLLHMYPEQRVFIDSRADVYRDDFIERYLATYYVTPRWREALERYQVEYVLVETGGPLHTLLQATGEWRERYKDSVAALLEPAVQGR